MRSKRTKNKRPVAVISRETTPVPLEHVSSLGSLLAALLPELSVVATVVWFLIYTGNTPGSDQDGLLGGAFLDGVMLMFSATLIDIASRLKRQPPWWLMLTIVLGVLLINPFAFVMLKAAASMDLLISLPFAWSLIERFRELWTLPSASILDKLRRRTLTFDRLYCGLVLAILCVIGGVFNALQNDGSMELDLFQRALPWLLLTFYAIAAFNVWRVHRAAFAKRPRSLFPFIDGDQASYVSPL